jgi:hypothetical protein
MKTLLAFTFLLCALSSFARTEAPVTQEEAATVFTKAEQVLKTVLRHKDTPKPFPSSKAIASREQILKHFLAIYTAVQPKFKITISRMKTAPSVINVKSPEIKSIAIKLESLGLIDRFGPLVTGKAEGLQPNEFGDALGYFIARVAELTHTPTTKFSPYLSPP